jgi:oxygen-independent coproporphyrinogen-3 oxidase
MQPETVAAVIDAAQRRFTFSNDIEISLEANPGSSDAGRFAEYSIAGVNRLSIGVQALDDGDLRRLGRQHSVRDGLSAVDAALRSVPRVSFDLIYARQDQTPDQWAKELAVALSLGTEHLSLYQLTIEPETQFGRRHARNRLPGLPDDDRAADMFAITQNMTANSGFPAYETSNHARGGAECRHNLIYWRSGDWLGIGPGAHGRLSAPAGRLATEHIRSPAAWLADIAAGGLGEAERTPVDRHDAGEERLMMGLRLVEGVPIAALDGLDGSPRFAASCRALVDSGHLELEAGHLRLTTQGRPLLDAVLRQLLV